MRGLLATCLRLLDCVCQSCNMSGTNYCQIVKMNYLTKEVCRFNVVNPLPITEHLCLQSPQSYLPLPQDLATHHLEDRQASAHHNHLHHYPLKHSTAILTAGGQHASLCSPPYTALPPVCPSS
ncbi:hypothetical protein M440DRAFT_334975 [Trichoderma longibrachiatum ATCC 18648]|uniref:Uncharacterized protein n=1 Tax=Trichoderma longibrachiatum ATCC 18648 TaxID=983965 RepID=A0A2T4C0C9_TRILO|nr:hypothetical protein M440DRAFT_334975 [Trichoderma longibrachiatum ATCC 18648]